MKHLRGEYMKDKNINGRSGHSCLSTRIFNLLDDILGHRPIANPERIVDVAAVHVRRNNAARHAMDVDHVDGTPAHDQESASDQSLLEPDEIDENTLDDSVAPSKFMSLTRITKKNTKFA
jgi:hypothetical protein